MKKLFIGLIALTVFVGSAAAMEAPRRNTIKLEIANQMDYVCGASILEVTAPHTSKPVSVGFLDPYSSLETEFDYLSPYNYLVWVYVLNGHFFEISIKPGNKLLIVKAIDQPGPISGRVATLIGTIENPTDVLLIIEPNGKSRLVDKSGMKK